VLPAGTAGYVILNEDQVNLVITGTGGFGNLSPPHCVKIGFDSAYRLSNLAGPVTLNI